MLILNGKNVDLQKKFPEKNPGFSVVCVIKLVWSQYSWSKFDLNTTKLNSSTYIAMSWTNQKIILSTIIIRMSATGKKHK
jgi:hypothetical protein